MELAFGISLVVLGLVNVAINFARVRNRESERLALGRHYAKAAVAHARLVGGDSLEVRMHAKEGFIIMDKALDGKRDFSDGEVAIYVGEALNEAP